MKSATPRRRSTPTRDTQPSSKADLRLLAVREDGKLIL
jgi:hypothetical protein